MGLYNTEVLNLLKKQTFKSKKKKNKAVCCFIRPIY